MSDLLDKNESVQGMNPESKQLRRDISIKGRLYEIFEPDSNTKESAQQLFDKIQTRASNPSSVFLPSGFGILIKPNNTCIVFSTFGAGSNKVFEIGEFDNISSAETSDVRFCGVVKTFIGEGYKLLAHSGGPESVRDLATRGIDLAIQNGVNITGLSVSLYVNPRLGHDIYINGPAGYSASLQAISDQIVIKQINVSDIDLIKIQ